MWYFSWVLGLGLACAFAILNAMWLELDPRGAEDPLGGRKGGGAGGRSVPLARKLLAKMTCGALRSRRDRSRGPIPPRRAFRPADRPPRFVDGVERGRRV